MFANTSREEDCGSSSGSSIEIVICNGPVFIKDTEYRDYEQARAQMIADNIPPDFEEQLNDEDN